MKVTIDAHEIHEMTAALENVPRNAWVDIYEAVRQNSFKIRDSWVENLGGKNNPQSTFRHMGRSIDFDMGAAGSLLSSAFGTASGIESVIGPNLAKRQGAFVGWWEFGMRNIPALYAGHDALRKNEQDLIDGLMDAAEKALERSL